MLPAVLVECSISNPLRRRASTRRPRSRSLMCWLVRLAATMRINGRATPQPHDGAVVAGTCISSGAESVRPLSRQRRSATWSVDSSPTTGAKPMRRAAANASPSRSATVAALEEDMTAEGTRGLA